MAVPEQTPYIEHTGNGVTTSFALKFQCESKDHLIVLIDDIEPPIETWSLSGGNVVFTTAPAAGKKITAQRNTPFSRTTDYQSYNNSFRPPAVNKDFDWIWWKLQELGVADWILGARIDALKNYVDRKDDELKAYLMEEIRKQGVALDQLDEYYNYLMQRLAQIAVDKGWDASFVVTASGETQQDINDFGGAKWRNKAGGYALGATVKLDNGDIVKSTIDGNTNDPNVDMTGWAKIGEITVSSVAKLTSIQNPKTGNIANALSYYEPILGELSPYRGGGRFVYDAAKSAINDGVLCFNGWVRVKNYTEITPYMAGCVGDGTTDDSDNFQKLITVSKGSFTIGSTGFFLITKPVGWPTNLLQAIGDGTPNATRAYKMKVTGYGATILVKSVEAIFTSERSLSNPLSTQDLYTGKIEFNGLKFRGDSIASVVFNGDRLYNTKVVGCEFIRCTKVLHSHINRGVGHPNGYIQSFSLLKNDFLLCNRIVDAKRAYNFRFIENDCEANIGGIYIDGDGDPALNACRINDNLFEGGGLFAKLGAMLGCSIKGNYLEGNNQYDAAALKCHIYMVRVGTGGYTSGCVIEGNAFQAVEPQKTDVDWADIKYSTALNTVQDTIAQPILLANWSNSYALISRNTITTQIGNGSPNLQRSAIPELHVQKRVDYKIKQQTFLSSTHLSAGVHTVAELDVAQVRALVSQSARAQTADLNILIQCVSASGVPVGSAVAKIALVVHGDEFVGTGAVNDVYVGAVLSGFAEIPEGSLINSIGDTFKSHFTSPAASLTRSGNVYQVKLSGYAAKPNPNYGAATQIKSSCTLIGFGFNSGVNLLPQLKLV